MNEQSDAFVDQPEKHLLCGFLREITHIFCCPPSSSRFLFAVTVGLLVSRLLIRRATKWKVRMEGIFPFIREWTTTDGVGDDSHRDDAGNFSDFLGRISLGVNQSGGKTVIAERLGVIARATLCRWDCLSDNFSCSCVITSDGPLSCLVCILLF